MISESRLSGNSQLIWTSQTASQMPHRPEMTKKISLPSGVGRQTSRVTMRATWSESAKHITGLRPVIFTILPVKMAASPLQTPKHIITKPMLLMPQPQETNAWNGKKVRLIRVGGDGPDVSLLSGLWVVIVFVVAFNPFILMDLMPFDWWLTRLKAYWVIVRLDQDEEKRA